MRRRIAKRWHSACLFKMWKRKTNTIKLNNLLIDKDMINQYPSGGGGFPNTGGGGGGSYNNGSNVSNSAAINSGNGKVIITKL
jgi:hypothetical protein